MVKLYSATTGGFYSREVHGKSVPKDAVEITDKEYSDMMDGQANGRVISAGLNGKPKLVPHIHKPQPSPDLQAAIQAIINDDMTAAQKAMDRKI